MLILILLSLGNCQLNELLRAWDDEIYYSTDKAKYIFQQIIGKPEYIQELKNNTQMLSKFYREYGQFLLYGLDGEDNIDYGRALYFMKLSGDLGNTRALYYQSMMTYFRLDGSYMIEQNLMNTSSHPKLQAYIQDKYLSVSLIDLYFSAMQFNQEAGVAMGYRHLIGIGVERNCSSAALFYLPILDEFLIQPEVVKHMVQNKRIAELPYNSEFYQNHELDIVGHADIFYNLLQITHESLVEVKQLAHCYFYGLNGLKRNYTKAFDLYWKMYVDVFDKESQIRVGLMIIEQLGTKNKDYDLAYQLLNVETKNSELLGMAQNGIGYIYYKGLGRDRNILKAMEYFKGIAIYIVIASANNKNADGHFNLASLLMLPSTLEKERNPKKAIHHFEQASAMGHAMAQYSLALLLLDGVELFYSCELAATLMHNALQKGEWSDGLMTANVLFQQKKYEKALIRYMEAAYNGYLIGIQNVGVLMQDYSALHFDNDHFSTLQDRLERDVIYLQLDGQENAREYLFQDYFELLKENKTQLYEYLKGDSQQLSGFWEKKLFQQCAKQKETICYMKLGDYYYYGLYEEQNLELAYEYYQKAAKSQDLIDAMQGHTYFNLGYMKAMGLGVEQNLNDSLKYFDQSLSSFTLIPGLPNPLQLQFIGAIMNIYAQISQLGLEKYLESWHILEMLEQQEQEFIEYLLENQTMFLSVGLSVIFIFFYGLKLKYENHQE